MTTDDLTLICEPHRGRDHGLHYWLVSESLGAVTYVKVYDDYMGFPVSLCDIETRADVRGYGFARRALELIAAKYSVERVHHDGGYTPDGLQCIHKLVEGRSAAERPIFDPMTFVLDWEAQERKYN